MSLTKDKKAEIAGKFGHGDGDTGSTEVQVALLTVYDMCKAVDRAMVIEAVMLLEKRGGRSGDWTRPPDPGP